MESVEAARGRLETVLQRLAEACRRSGRSPDSVQLLAVSKLRPVGELELLYDLGIRAFGENRVPEALKKQRVLAGDIEWHLIGHLQSNKAKECLGFSWIHSIDRVETAQALEKHFGKAEKTVNILLEANTGGEVAKDGVRDLDGLRYLAEAVARMPHLKVRGLMTMAPFSPDEAVVRPCFVRLRNWRDSLAVDFPELDWKSLSMGMSNDFPWAVEEGSTVVRIGTALFEGAH